MDNLSKQINKQIVFKKKSNLMQDIIKYKYMYLILFPGILFFILFCYVPMYGIQLAFKDFWINKGIWGSPLAGADGLDKFRMLLVNKDFLNAFKNTLVISGMKLVIGFPIPIIIALLINELTSVKVKKVLQTIFTFPHFLSWVILSGIVMTLLSTDGVVNNVIFSLGGNRVPFMTNPDIFRGMLIFTDIWKEAGWSAIMYLAAMSSIDQTLYEGATIDGASRWQSMLNVTWPGIKSMAAMLFILAVGNTMNVNFDQVFNFYNPAVFESADIIDTFVYRITFQAQGDYGFSTAVSLFKGVINCGLLLTANRIVKKLSDDSLF